MLVVIKFRIGPSLRFLSHAETVRVFQRACARAGIRLQYSQGFNPRPKLSLPLPRSVGVETEDDLLCLRVQDSPSSFSTERFKAALSVQLPDGCELLSVGCEQSDAQFQPRLATYLFTLRPEYIDRKLKAAVKRLLASNSLNLDRRIDAKGNIRSVDVRPFLESVQLKGRDIIVDCRISSAGTIRVEEILKLLELDAHKCAAPVRRTSVKWQEKSLEA
ncbi:MAG: TIGR03936 family radical SAM-associated protein [Planctomycetota bacterium]